MSDPEMGFVFLRDKTGITKKRGEIKRKIGIFFMTFGIYGFFFLFLV